MAKTVSIEIDVEEALGLMDDSDIREEAESRDLDFSAGRLDEAFADGLEEAYESSKEDVLVAINQIRTGRYDDAIITLERAFLPTWQDQAAAEARYREVMAEKRHTPVSQAQEAA